MMTNSGMFCLATPFRISIPKAFANRLLHVACTIFNPNANQFLEKINIFVIKLDRKNASVMTKMCKKKWKWKAYEHADNHRVRHNLLPGTPVRPNALHSFCHFEFNRFEWQPRIDSWRRSVTSHRTGICWACWGSSTLTRISIWKFLI